MLLQLMVGVVRVVVFFAAGIDSIAKFARVSRRSCAVANAFGVVVVATAVATIDTTATMFGSSRSTSSALCSSAAPGDLCSRKKEHLCRIGERGELHLPYSSLQPLYEGVDTEQENIG